MSAPHPVTDVCALGCVIASSFSVLPVLLGALASLAALAYYAIQIHDRIKHGRGHDGS